MTSPNNSPASVELLPCPFCGSNTASVSDNGRGLIFHVRCDKCRAAGPGERCASDAIAAWNTRTPSPASSQGKTVVSEAVTQADREAAARLSEQIAGPSNGKDQIARCRKGLEDSSYLVQAFARHRIAALSKALGEDE